MLSAQKKHRGQFYTTTNPFSGPLFGSWLASIPADARAGPWLEPFAGSNNLVKMLADTGRSVQWDCFDIAPGINAAPAFAIQERDTLASFPSGYTVAITNPPYLARNSATRSGLSFPDCGFDDLYKFALATMLAHVGYVCAIVPESFITSGLFHDRLYGVASLTSRLFDDTECPVCLAMFVPASCKADPQDFLVDSGRSFVQLTQERDRILRSFAQEPWQFNDPKGVIGLHAVDGQTVRSIRFVSGSSIPGASVKSTSRSITRIDGLPRGVSVDEVVDTANEILADLRDTTADVFLTAFKGLRSDGDYRRRLDYALARRLLDASVDQVRARAAFRQLVRRIEIPFPRTVRQGAMDLRSALGLPA
ncbi:MAG: hypothetical protein EPN58_11420 [Rhodanobacter sp.]|nr:MAG: hypothetical protein EPN58_11420 [Rhodanobacter sp.]